MPLSQAISDTDCIMREYNQLTAAGSYGERMILNRNQYKLNLTLSLAEQNSELDMTGEKRQAGGPWRVPQWLGCLPSVPHSCLGGLLILFTLLFPHSLPFSPFLPLLTTRSVSQGCQVNGAIFSQASFSWWCCEQATLPLAFHHCDSLRR